MYKNNGLTKQKIHHYPQNLKFLDISNMNLFNYEADFQLNLLKLFLLPIPMTFNFYDGMVLFAD